MTNNTDPAELAKFAAQAAHWWDEHGEMRTLHQINPLRIGYIKEKIQLAGKNIIDIGCGGGILSEQLAAEGATVTGIDMNVSLIDVANLHLLETGRKVHYHVSTAETFAAEHAGQYDLVTCLEMLEHVPDPLSVIKACAQLVKPGGHVFFSTLNRNLKSYCQAIVGAEYLLKLLPKDTHDYSKFIQPAELAAWCREAGLTPVDLRGIQYHLFEKTFSLTHDVSVNYLFYARRDT